MTNPFSLDEFEAFCRSKPEDEEYAAGFPRLCALAQFGFPGIVTHDDRFAAGIPYFVYSTTVGKQPFTFGALADRLAKLREREDA